MNLSQALESALADLELVNASAQQTASLLTDEFREEANDVVSQQQAIRAVVRQDAVQEEIIQASQMCNDMEIVQAHIGEVEVGGQISTESYLLCTQLLKSSKYGKRYAPAIGPSLESINSSEVTVSVEGLTDMLSAALRALGKLGIRLLEELGRSFSFLSTRVTLARAKTKGLLVDVGRVKGELPQIKIEGRTKYLTPNGKSMGHAEQAKYLLQSFEIMSHLVGVYPDQVLQALQSNANMADTINTDNAEVFRKTLEKFVSAWKDPRDKLPHNAGDFVLPGGVKLFQDGKPTYTGNDALLKKLDEIGYKRQLKSMLWQQPNARVDEDNGKMESFTKDEVRALANAMSKFFNSVDRGQLTMRAVIAQLRTGMLLAPPGLVSMTGFRIFAFLYTNGMIFLLRSLPTVVIPGARQYPTEYRLIKRALAAQSGSLKNVYFDTTDLAARTAGYVIRQCRASIDDSLTERSR